MKVFFRGYNRTATIMSHTDLIDNFRTFECNNIADINITYTSHLLLSEQAVYVGDCCSKMCQKGFKLPIAEKIFRMSGTNNYIIALCDNGKLLKIKINNRNEIDIATLPKLLSNHNNDSDKIVNIACGSKINVAVSKAGKIFNIPVELNFQCKTTIVDVAVGKEHCILLDQDGKTYTFGSGSRGQLGHGNLENETEPKFVEGLGGIKIVKVSASGWHSCALSQDGDMYTWGWNGNSQLGLGANVSVMATPSVVDFVDTDNQVNVVKVACGARHTIALTDDNKLYGCGWNKYKQINNTNEENVAHMEFLYDFKDFNVNDLKCGPWSSLVVCS